MPDRLAIFSICSRNYLPQAAIFFGSARAAHPDADLFLGLADTGPAEIDGVTVLCAADLGIPDFADMAFRYDVMEFNTAIKPFVFLRLLERGYDAVLYFDPDIMIFRPLAEVLDALEAGASFALTPHFTTPPGIDAPRSEAQIMRTGVYNLGFLACSQRPETEPLLRWWARKLRFECVNEQSEGLFVDQKFMDLMPGFAADLRILRDTTLNVAYWNLAQRRLDRTADGWTVDGTPLGFFHFSGFNPREPARLSKHVAPRPLPEPLLDLLAFYASSFGEGHGPGAEPYGYGRFQSGTPIPQAARTFYRSLSPGWTGDPFANFEAQLSLPSPHATLGKNGEVVTNLMHHIHQRSPELQGRFDLGNRFHVTDFIRWFRQQASDLGIASSLL